MEDALAAARAVAGRIAGELEIPVYFYEEAATRPDRQNLENVRRGEFERLRDTIATDEDRIPDLGPRRVHPTAGATIVGARRALIAYNIYLNTNDLKVARAIARTVRHSSGGLRYVKALGLDIPARGQVQVSMNLTDFRRTSLHTVFNLVRDEAAAFGVQITDSEVVGLIPMDALVSAARHYLRLRHFEPEQILELRLLDS
jgi:glutamate formiminotransferase